MQARDVERRREQERGAAILQQQLAERQAQRVREEELRDQVGAPRGALALRLLGVSCCRPSIVHHHSGWLHNVM